ncbi:hypothetical protein [Scytonema sp. NUACC26]|uniref:hypothetical protein n=1 Tax=Scytonema sp. NUACC26 TaxID=3140176 RepID=UPI0034DC8527
MPRNLSEFFTFTLYIKHIKTTHSNYGEALTTMKNTTRNVFALGLMSLLSLNVMSQGAFAAQAQTANLKNSKASTTAHSVHRTAQHSLKKKHTQQHAKKPAANMQALKSTNTKESTTKGGSAANVATPNTTTKK